MKLADSRDFYDRLEEFRAPLSPGKVDAAAPGKAALKNGDAVKLGLRETSHTTTDRPTGRWNVSVRAHESRKFEAIEKFFKLLLKKRVWGILLLLSTRKRARARALRKFPGRK